jgi:hypothetical protein
MTAIIFIRDWTRDSGICSDWPEGLDRPVLTFVVGQLAKKLLFGPVKAIVNDRPRR